MTASRKTLGAFGEKYAQAHLARSGYRLIELNVRLPSGEIDIVAQDSSTLVFVEVRTRRGTRLGPPEESITPRKAERMRRLAYQYLDTRGNPEGDWRIDVVAVEVGGDGRVTRLDIIKNAVDDSGGPA